MKTLKTFAAFAAATLTGFAAFAAAPANDNKADAIALPGDSGSLTATFKDATAETEGGIDWAWEGSAHDHTVWYKFTAPRAGLLVVTASAPGTPRGFSISAGFPNEKEEADYGWNGDETVIYLEAGETGLVEVSAPIDTLGGEDDDVAFTLNWKLQDAPNGPWDIDEYGFVWGYLGRKTDVSSVTVPDGAKEIGEEAFYRWGDLEDVTIPGSVTNIQCCAFVGCHDLVTLNLTEGLIAIDDWAFDESGLEYLRLPSTVTEITTNAFYGIDGEVIVYAPLSLKGKLQSTTLSYSWKEVFDDGNGMCHEETHTVTTKLTVIFGIHNETTEPVPTSAACQYDGAISGARGRLLGTITLKVGKANARTGVSTVSGTAQIGNKKTRFKGTFKDGTLTADNGVALKLDARGMTGTFGSYEVDGVRNVFTAKDTASKATAQEALKRRKGVYTVAWSGEGSESWGGVSVTVGNKGKVKVTGTLQNGTKVTANAQLLAGAGLDLVPISSTKQKAPLAFKLWYEGSELLPDGLAKETEAGKVGGLKDGLKVFSDGLPAGGVPVTVNGKKWVTVTDKTVALKLTFNPKAGTFKGSFKKGKQRATVTGVVVDGRGYGSATIKKVGTEGLIIAENDD